MSDSVLGSSRLDADWGLRSSRDSGSRHKRLVYNCQQPCKFAPRCVSVSPNRAPSLLRDPYHRPEYTGAPSFAASYASPTRTMLAPSGPPAMSLILPRALAESYPHPTATRITNRELTRAY